MNLLYNYLMKKLFDLHKSGALNEEEFQRLIQNQEFLEYAKVFNNLYGTTRTPIIDKLNRRKNLLFDIELLLYQETNTSLL